MKFLKILVPAVTLVVGALIITTPNASCTKKEIIHDTTIVKDTVNIHDTLACCSADSSMIAYYTFTNGSLKDSSGLGNDIVFNNATQTTDHLGHANGAYLFNGTSSYMQVKNSASLANPGNITIMANVKLNGFFSGPCHGNQILMKGYRDQVQGAYSLRVIDLASDCYVPVDTSREKAQGFIGDYGYNSYATDTVNYIKPGRWYNFIYTYDGSVSKIYVNGVLKSSTKITTVFNPNSYDLFIGRAEDPAINYWLNGVIDEVRVYNRALCASAVASLSKGFQAY